MKRDIVRIATSKEVEEFIQEQSHPCRKSKGLSYKEFSSAICTSKNLAKGKVQFVNGEMLNPVKLDLSGLKKKG